MVGDGDDLPRYQAQVAALGLDRPRRLPASRCRRARPLRWPHLIVVPSRAEAMPYIVLEALAAGKPMIATAVGGIPEIFGAGSPALVRPDAARSADKMARGARRPCRLSQPDAERADLKARFSADVMASRHREGLFRRASDAAGHA